MNIKEEEECGVPILERVVHYMVTLQLRCRCNAQLLLDVISSDHGFAS
jgi:hypothetical protein